MKYHDLNNLRLEIETADAGLPNLIENPYGEKGAWGYVTPVANTLITADKSNRVLTFKTTASQACYFTSEYLPVAAGQFVSARFDLQSVAASTNIVKVRFEWYDSSKVLLSSSTQSAGFTVGTAQTVFYGAIVAPASTAYVKMRWDFYTAASGNVVANSTVKFTNVMVTYTATGTVQSIRHNLSVNPSVETNTTGWSAQLPNGTAVTGASSTTQAAFGTKSFKVTNNSGSSNTINSYIGGDSSGYTPGISAGKSYNFSAHLWTATAGRVFYMRVQFLNSSNNPVGAGLFVGTHYTTAASSWNRGNITVTAPTGATKAQVSITMEAVANNEVFYLDGALYEQASSQGTYFDGNTTASGITYTWDGTANNSASTSTAAATAFDYSEPVTWRNIMAPVANITIDRDEMNVGSLTATVMDPALDPYNATEVRPGKKIRLQRLYGSSLWESVFEGILVNANVVYDIHNGQIVTQVNLSAFDNWSVLANQAERRGVSTLAQLPYILEGKGVPWDINGNGNQVTSATIVATNDNASVVDQIAVSRDTAMAYAWCSRNNVISVYDSATINNLFTWSFGDNPDVDGSASSYFPGASVDYDMSRVINSVTVTWLRYNIGTGQTEEVTYGPYVDQTSIDTWGAYSANFTIQGATESSSTIAAYAAAVLTANSTPQRRMNSLTFPIKDGDTFTAATIDLYDAVGVTYSNIVGPFATYRVTGIKHNITPTEWTVELDFTTTGSVAAPTVIPSPETNTGSTSTGVPFYNRGRSSNLSVATSTNTFVSFGSVLQTTQGGITDDGAGTLTIPTAGVYEIRAAVWWDNASATGNRQINVFINGTQTYTQQIVGSTSVPFANQIGVIHRFAAGDTMAIKAFQNSGGSLNITGDVLRNYLQVYRIGD